jgi:hypothetical protein
VNGALVAAMGDVLALYAEEYEEKRPKVNFDGTSRQLTADLHPPVAVAAGRPQREEHEYERNGTRTLFLVCEPHAGWRHVTVTERRTKPDFAQQMRWLVERRYPKADVIGVILDNLNTHGPGSLYDAFEPAEARRLVGEVEFHYPPKHGSWVNMAEIELSLLPRRCLNRRLAHEAMLKREVAAWEQHRNEAQEPIAWRFTITEAREKLKRLYPTKSLR